MMLLAASAAAMLLADGEHMFTPAVVIRNDAFGELAQAILQQLRPCISILRPCISILKLPPCHHGLQVPNAGCSVIGRADAKLQ